VEINPQAERDADSIANWVKSEQLETWVTVVGVSRLSVDTFVLAAFRT
jgi:hypothetical protein